MIDDKGKSVLIKQIELCFEESVHTSNKSKELRESNFLLTEEKEANLRNASIFRHISILYETQGASLSFIYEIMKKLENVSTIEDIQNIRKEIAGKVESTLSPIVEQVEKFREIEKNAKDIYK